MSKAVVKMLHRWWQQLAETELICAECTQEDLLHLLDLPAPGETVALNQIGLARVEITTPVRSLNVWFLEPLVFEDVVAVFGRGAPGVCYPDSSDRPHFYDGDHPGAASFVFTVSIEVVMSDIAATRRIEICHSLCIRLPFRPQDSVAPKRPIADPPPLAPIVTPPVGRFRLWLRRLRSR